jgi:hypothetical protein
MGNLSHTTGSVSIGTSTPVANTPLLVQGDGDGIGTIRLQIEGSGGSLNYGSIIVSGTQASGTVESKWKNSFVLEGVPLADSTGASGSTIISSFDRDLQFHTGQRAERMRITNNGNVGIGTNNPTTKLDVNGTIRGVTVDTNYVRSAAGTNAINVPKLSSGPVGFGGGARYTRGITMQINKADFTVTTAGLTIDGASFGNITGIAPSSILKFTYVVPTRSDTATTWGGLYIEPQISFNATDSNPKWYALGTSGYDGAAMFLNSSSIATYVNTFLIDPVPGTHSGVAAGAEYSARFRFKMKSYDGSTLINLSHEIGGRVGSETLLTSLDPHFFHIIVEELALFA